MDVTIEQSCPSCGAAIVLAEDDRLIRCAYCDVHHYKIGSVADRYLLPCALPDQIGPDQLIFLPYLRFKGSVLYVRDEEVKYKIIDTTRLGLENEHLPISLGLRPQAMKIHPVVSASPGAFILQAVPTKSVFIQAAMIIDLFREHSRQTTYHRAFIGETISRIYQPCYLRDEQLWDAVSKRVIGPGTLIERYLAKTCSSKSSWEPRFINTICPGCGGLLDGDRDSTVLQCKNCESLWREEKGRFRPIDWKVVASDGQSARYLPFWQISFSTSGHVLRSFADYLRYTNQPLAIRGEYEARPLVFWIPAFKINPKAFLQLASQLTVGQAHIPSGEVLRVANGYPVTLDQKEAFQAIKSVLANTTLCRERSYPLLPEIKPLESRCELTYLPFASQSHDLVQEHTLAVVQTTALRYGRSL